MIRARTPVAIGTNQAMRNQKLRRPLRVSGEKKKIQRGNISEKRAGGSNSGAASSKGQRTALSTHTKLGRSKLRVSA